MSIDVAGLRYRKPDVIKFINGANEASAGNFGVVARREPNNPHSRHGHATAVDGWWLHDGFFRESKKTAHIGYLPEWASQECLEGRSPEPAIFVDLYSCYLGHDDFVDVDIIVYVEQSPDEVREQEESAAVRILLKSAMPGLKVLARIGAMSERPNAQGELAIMKGYVESRAKDLGITASPEGVGRIAEAASGLAPSDSAVMAAVRAMALDDNALAATFSAAIALARLDGKEGPGEVKLLKRILATAGRARAKSAVAADT